MAEALAEVYGEVQSLMQRVDEMALVSPEGVLRQDAWGHDLVDLALQEVGGEARGGARGTSPAPARAHPRPRYPVPQRDSSERRQDLLEGRVQHTVAQQRDEAAPRSARGGVGGAGDHGGQLARSVAALEMGASSSTAQPRFALNVSLATLAGGAATPLDAPADPGPSPSHVRRASVALGLGRPGGLAVATAPAAISPAQCMVPVPSGGAARRAGMWPSPGNSGPLPSMAVGGSGRAAAAVPQSPTAPNAHGRRRLSSLFTGTSQPGASSPVPSEARAVSFGGQSVRCFTPPLVHATSAADGVDDLAPSASPLTAPTSEGAPRRAQLLPSLHGSGGGAAAARGAHSAASLDSPSASLTARLTHSVSGGLEAGSLPALPSPTSLAQRRVTAAGSYGGGGAGGAVLAGGGSSPQVRLGGPRSLGASLRSMRSPVPASLASSERVGNYVAFMFADLAAT